MVRPDAVSSARSTVPDGTCTGTVGAAEMATLTCSPRASAIWEARVRIQISW